MKDEKILKGVLEVLEAINSRLAALEDALLDEQGQSRIGGIQVAIGEFHHDVAHKNEQQDQAIGRLHDRHKAFAARIGDLEKALRTG